MRRLGSSDPSAPKNLSRTNRRLLRETPAAKSLAALGCESQAALRAEGVCTTEAQRSQRGQREIDHDGTTSERRGELHHRGTEGTEKCVGD